MDAQKKKIFGNTLYTIGGALVLNGVLQLFVYPKLNARLGAEALGTMIYMMGLINILGPSVGQALNNSRLVVRRTHEVTNGDYDVTLLFFTAVGLAVIAVLARTSLPDAGTVFIMALTGLLTVFRFYGDVEYRMSLNYRRYFIYYSAAGTGYLIGYLIFLLTGNWYFIFLVGEALALAYLSLKGTVFKDFFRTGPGFKIVEVKGLTLVLSYLITNTTFNIDRLVLKNMIGGTAVTEYYVASLIGKTLVLLVAPVNTIIISYLTKEKKALGKSRFLKFSGAGLLVAAAFFGVCEAATPVFIRLFYTDLAEATAPYITVINLTQILSVLSAYLFILVLTFTEARWQLILQCAHLVLLALLVFTMTGSGGLMGFSCAVLIANTFRIAAVLVLGLLKAGRTKEVVCK
ncbi:MAG TPA: hypothetical protein PLN48_02795 [Lachnospiraceae bacterium]|nr:hypothetical protein [Lachnospiraceae bacterium]